MKTVSSETYDLIIVGAGPSGLSCAIEAVRAGLSVVILEKGSIVDYLRRFPTNVVWFSTPPMLEIGDIPFITTTFRPTRIDTVNYYQRVARHFNLDIRCYDAVEKVGRREGRYEVATAGGRLFTGHHVVLATGYFDHPNRLGVPGEELPHVNHYYDEPFLYNGADVAVVGGRNSAVEATLDLFRHGARVTLIHRGEELSQGVKYWILPDIRNRIEAGEVQALFSSTVREIRRGTMVVNTPGGIRAVKADFVFVLIGFSPDVSPLRRFGIDIDSESLAPVHDPATFETNLPGLFVAGSLTAGRYNNKVFVENGRLHGGSIVSRIIERKRSRTS